MTTTDDESARFAAHLDGLNQAERFTALQNLLVVPGQTQQQLADGYLTYMQVRQELVTVIRGNAQRGQLTYQELVQHVMNTVQEFPILKTAIDSVKKQIDTVTSELQPLLTRANEQLITLQQQSDELRQATATEITNQGQQHQTLIQHAKDKFEEMTQQQTATYQSQQLLTDAARGKFDEMEALRQQFEVQMTNKMQELDAKTREVSTAYGMLVNMGQADVVAARAKVAEVLGNQGGPGPGPGNQGGFNREPRAISEYKAVASLERCTTDNRGSFKNWIIKLKNTLDQARGTHWRKALEAIELQKFTDDFEELTDLDEKWDDWFQDKFGANRMDGGLIIDIAQFKSEMAWMLTEKVGENLLELIKKHKQNGMRAYKKLFTWSVDVSNTAKSESMKAIMNPERAKTEEGLAAHIESWDRDREELVKVDPACELKMPFLLIAFKNLLPVKMIEHIENQLSNEVQENYEEIRKKVYGWALRKKREHASGKTGGSNPMSSVDIPDNLDCKTPPADQCGPGYPQGNMWGGGDQWSQWNPQWDQGMDALGKGKGQWKGGARFPKGGGKGGGKSPPVCWNCGKPGHRAFECRSPPNPNRKGGGKGGKKGKGGKLNEFDNSWPGYGKGPNNGQWGYPPPGGNMDQVAPGQFNGTCYNCGEWGHRAADCTKPKGAGKGGQMSEVNQGAGQQQQQQQQQTQVGGKVESLDLGSLDTGGDKAKEEQEEFRPREGGLLELVKQAGWQTQGKRGKPPSLQAMMDLCALTSKAVRFQDEPSVNSVNSSEVLQEGKAWKEILITVDSGACDHVVPPGTIDPKDVRVTDAVKNGVTYYTASGHALPNLGEISLKGITGDGQDLTLNMQVAGVKKPLASVRKMCQAGNRVVFENGPDGTGGYVENKTSGAKVPIDFGGGTYQVAVWTQIDKKSSANAIKGNYWADIADVDEDEEVVFEGGNRSSSAFQRPA